MDQLVLGSRRDSRGRLGATPVVTKKSNHLYPQQTPTIESQDVLEDAFGTQGSSMHDKAIITRQGGPHVSQDTIPSWPFDDKSENGSDCDKFDEENSIARLFAGDRDNNSRSETAISDSAFGVEVQTMPWQIAPGTVQGGPPQTPCPPRFEIRRNDPIKIQDFRINFIQIRPKLICSPPNLKLF